MRTLHAVPMLVLALAYAAPAAAAGWCLNDSRGGSNCGFATFEQCMANQAGVGGTCQRDPYDRGGSTAGAQQPNQPASTPANWCLNDSRGGSNCGFRSFEQCMVNQAGVGGTCQRNPY